MTKHERVRAALAGDPVDRPPFAFWYHFRGVPPVGDAFVRATLDFYRDYEPDLLKVMHDAPYDMPVDHPVLEEPGDWRMLPINPPDSGSFGEQIRALRNIRDYKNDDAPLIETVPSAFTVAEQLTNGRTLEMLDKDPAAVMTGLKHLAAAYASYAKAAIEEAGCAGIFLAVNGASGGVMGAERYAADFLPLDRLVLAGAFEGWCNIVHLHGDDLHLDAALPLIEQAHAVSWSDRAYGPSLSDVRARTGKCVVGGVNERLVGGYTRTQVTDEVADALAQTDGGRGLIVAPGCTVPTETAPATLRAFEAAVGGAPAGTGTDQS